MTQPTSNYPGGVYIPPEQIYSEVRATRDAVAQLSSDLQGLRRDLEAVSPLETRVRSLETRIASYMQPVGAAGGLAGIGTLLWSLLNK
ncbi:hypothetical protein ACFRCW_42470 [Streptomyces sp. NPDC056653]|uniref:hypothetical protein n=1 Tax=Streptomyces sp. NPDC056653 TaxID=3345894 RepID=UPI0036C2CEB9